MPAPAPRPSDFFLAKISGVSGSDYAFSEWWVDSTGSAVQKVGGRYGTVAENPGRSADGSTFAVGDFALARSADGNGGLSFELYKFGGGGAAPSAWKQPVRVATTANGTLSTAFANGQTVDGVALVTGDRILIKNQTAQAENGIYTVNASGAPTRATDANTGALLLGAACVVTNGTTNADTVWLGTANATITVGLTALPWVRISASGAAGDVFGPASATDNAIARYDSTTGKLIQNSLATIDDTGTLTLNSGTGSLYFTNNPVPVSVTSAYLVAGGVTGPVCNLYLKSLYASDSSIFGVWVGVPDPVDVQSGTFSARDKYRVAGTSGQNFSGINATCTVKVGGVDRTMTIVGGIVVDIS